MNMKKYDKLAMIATLKKTTIPLPTIDVLAILDAYNMGMYHRICIKAILDEAGDMVKLPYKNNTIQLDLCDLLKYEKVLTRFIRKSEFDETYAFLNNETKVISNLNVIIETNRKTSFLNLVKGVNTLKNFTDSTHLGLLNLCKCELISRIPILDKLFLYKEEHNINI